MQEHSFIIEKQLGTGLRANKRSGRDVLDLEVMKNLKPIGIAAVSPEKVIYPIGCSGPTMDWPFPQLFRGERVTLECGATSVSVVSETAWTTTAQTTYDAADGSTTKAIVRGGLWQHASFQDLWFLTNGASLVWKIPSNTSDRVYTVTSLTVNTLCAHGSRLFMGGMAGAWFATSRWQYIVDTWRATLPEAVFAHEDLALSTNWVIFGEPGGGADDIPFLPMLAALGVFGTATFDKFKEQIDQNIQDGKLGLIPVASTGMIRMLKGLGKDVIAYGANAVAKLSPVENRYVEGAVLASGVPGRGSVGGTAQEHVFVTNQEYCYRHTPQGIKNLDYSEFINAVEVFIREWGTAGTGNGELATPRDVAVDGQCVYVAEEGNVRVQEFDRNGNYVQKWSTGLSCPVAIFIYEDEVYVADNALCQIHVFTLAGAAVRSWGTLGTANGAFLGIESLFVYEDEVYVTDPGNDRVQVFSTAGVYTRKWGTNGTGNTNFKHPTGITVYRDRVYVCDSINHRVVKFKQDGTYVTQWGSYGATDGLFQMPQGITAYNEEIYVTESDGDRLQVFDLDGTFVRKHGSTGADSNEFTYPHGLTIADDRVYVADTSNNRILVLDPDLVISLIISHDPVEDDYWLANNHHSYILTPHGMGGPCDLSPTGLFRHETEGLVAAAEGMDEGTEVRVVSNQFDLMERGRKHITNLQLFTENLNTVRARIHYRYGNDLFAKSPYTPANRENVTTNKVTLVDGKVDVKGTVTEQPARIERIEVRYQPEDKRFVHGTKGIQGER